MTENEKSIFTKILNRIYPYTKVLRFYEEDYLAEIKMEDLKYVVQMDYKDTGIKLHFTCLNDSYVKPSVYLINPASLEYCQGNPGKSFLNRLASWKKTFSDNVSLEEIAIFHKEKDKWNTTRY